MNTNLPPSRGRGQPPVDAEGPRSVKLRVAIPVPLDGRLRARVEAEGRSMADVVCDALRLYVDGTAKTAE